MAHDRSDRLCHRTREEHGGCYAENGRDIIVRLFEPTGKKRSTTLRLPFVPMSTKVNLKGFEIKTLKINSRTKKVREVNLLER